MMPANRGEETPDSLYEGLVTARFDGVVPKKSDAVLAICEQIDAPPGHSVEEGLSAPRTQRRAW